jgi:hypothetical protein
MFQEMLALFLPRSYNGDASDRGTMIVGRFNLKQKIIENRGVKGVGARLIRPLLKRNCSRRIIYADGYTCQWSVGWPLNNSGCIRGIKLCTMTWAQQMLTGGIVLNRATCVCTSCIKCYKFPIVEVNQHPGIAVGRDGECDGTIGRNRIYLGDRRGCPSRAACLGSCCRRSRAGIRPKTRSIVSSWQRSAAL